MNLSDPTPAPCERCSEGPREETGHARLVLHLSGPYPGHHIFKCADCGERWIRHYGDETVRHAWTRHVQAFPPVGRRGQPVVERGKVFPF